MGALPCFNWGTILATILAEELEGEEEDVRIGEEEDVLEFNF